MKRILLLSIMIIALGNASFAQKIASENVPAAVNTAFKAKFSTAQKPVWEMDYDNYEVKFKNKKSDMSAKFSPEGAWLETATFINRSALPSAVKKALAKQFNTYVEGVIRKVETSSGVNYEMNLECNATDYNVIITEKGDFIKKEAK